MYTFTTLHVGECTRIWQHNKIGAKTKKLLKQSTEERGIFVTCCKIKWYLDELTLLKAAELMLRRLLDAAGHYIAATVTGNHLFLLYAAIFV